MTHKYTKICITLVGALLLAALLVLSASAQPGGPSAQPKANAPTASQSANSHSDDETTPGERVFQQQCSRCHEAPEGFSPRISGTVVRHMRVRAALSKEDERALLHFLNP